MKRRRRVVLFKYLAYTARLAGYVLILVLGVKVFRTDTEIVRLSRQVKELERDVASLRKGRASARGGVGSELAERVRDTRGNSFDTYSVHITTTSLTFYFRDETGKRLSNFENLKDYLAATSRELVFATNAGMYTAEGNPVGLFIEQGKVISPLNLKNGTANFYLKPNGVFALTESRAFVVDSKDFEKQPDYPSVLYATQSGPLLVINGEIHKSFDKESTNNNIRSGVGIISPTKLVFAISNNPVSFYDFAALFKDRFHCRDALYLDGTISRMYLPALKREEMSGSFAGIIAVADW